MGDKGDFNLCEYIWDRELAIHKLLNILRNSQNLCTDNECFQTDSTPAGYQNTSENVYLVTILFAAAIFLYFFRPSRQHNATANKPTSGHGPDDTNPPPPIN